MKKYSKRYKEILKFKKKDKKIELKEIIELVKKNSTTKFDESIDVFKSSLYLLDFFFIILLPQYPLILLNHK